MVGVLGSSPSVDTLNNSENKKEHTFTDNRCLSMLLLFVKDYSTFTNYSFVRYSGRFAFRSSGEYSNYIYGRGMFRLITLRPKKLCMCETSIEIIYYGL